MKTIKNIITGNYYNKYKSNYLLDKYFVNKYKNAFINIISKLEMKSVLEIGSGEGFILNYLLNNKNINLIIGSDIELEYVNLYSNIYFNIRGVLCIGEQLPFCDKIFDLVLLCEVLEHVNQPIKVIKEATRVSKDKILLTIPYEPFWRIMNLLRFKYISSFGNTPGHINHWSYRSIKLFLEEYMTIEVIQIVFPWIFILGTY